MVNVLAWRKFVNENIYFSFLFPGGAGDPARKRFIGAKRPDETPNPL
jgi:hypothetical protein